MNAEIKEITQKICKAKSIALFSHISCDCDTIGSMLGVYEVLKTKGKNVEMFCDDEKQNEFAFLDNFEKINFVGALTSLPNFSNYDLLIAIDSATILRLGRLSEAFTLTNRTINIDHHACNSCYAATNYVKHYSSCGEVVFEILEEAKIEINKTTATCLFAAISSDTNSFINSNVEQRTFCYAGKLIEKGANHNLVNVCLHKNKTKNNLKLISYMTKHVQVKNGVSSLVLSKRTLKKLGVQHGDVAKYLNIVGNIEEAKISFVAKQSDEGDYRVSLRSIGNYDVNKIASIFGGGGHKNASGCRFLESAKKQIQKLREVCEIEAQGDDN